MLEGLISPISSQYFPVAETEGLSLASSSTLLLQTLVHNSQVQMMPMPGSTYSDMWIWLALLAVILVLAVVIPILLLTRPRQTSPSNPQSQSPPPPASQTVEAPHTDVITEGQTEKPVTKTVQLRKAVELVRPTLNDDERRIVNEIVKAGGMILQSDLPEKSDFSKATVSKLVKSLETMGIVTREKHKWTYWVKLSDKLISGTKNA